MSRTTVTALKLAALGAVCLPAAIITLSSCTPECVDKYDCRAKETPSQSYTCDNGLCVPGDPGGDPDAGNTGGGAGGSGGTGGGVGGSGGGTGGGTGGTGGGTGGGSGGGTGGGTGGGSGGGTGGGSSVVFPTAGAYVFTLTGGQQVPPITSAETGSGTITLTALTDGGYDMAWNITHSLPTNGNPRITAAHIHVAAVGINNPTPTFTFSPLGSPMTGNATIAPTLADDISRGRAYVNVHSFANSGGEMRGQLMRPGESLRGTTLLDGGTREGGVGFFVNPDAGVTRYQGEWTNFVGASSHIHFGGPGETAGGIAHALTLGGTGLSVEGQIPGNAFTGGDGGFYVNVHDTGGAVLLRGQIGILVP